MWRTGAEDGLLARQGAAAWLRHSAGCYRSVEGTKMAERDDPEFRRRYGGRYVATRDGDVIASDDSYEQLSEYLERTIVEWQGVAVAYVDPFDVIRVY